MPKQKELPARVWSTGVSFRGLVTHPALWFLVATAAVIGGGVQVWNHHQAIIVNREDYQLTREKVCVNDPPVWGEADLKSLVLNQVQPVAADQPATLLDTSLVSKTVSVFQSVGWVERVRRVEKSRQGLQIDLIYRQPVGMVELNRTTVPDWPVNQDGKLLPVDRLGVIMPGSLAAHQPMLRFSVFEPARFTQLENWTEWPDARIQDAAEISHRIASRWQAWGLYRVVTFRRPDQPDDNRVPFELWPDAGVQVIWGSPPGDELENEVSAEEKIAAIESFVESFGPLNKLQRSRIDFRSGKPVVVSKAKTASLQSQDFGR